MFHIVLVLLVAAISVLGWLMVNSSPRVLAMILSPRLAFGTGAGFFILGLFCAFFQLYASVSYGPYLALLLASLLTPGLDRLFSPSPLV